MMSCSSTTMWFFRIYLELVSFGTKHTRAYHCYSKQFVWSRLDSHCDKNNCGNCKRRQFIRQRCKWTQKIRRQKSGNVSILALVYCHMFGFLWYCSRCSFMQFMALRWICWKCALWFICFCLWRHINCHWLSGERWCTRCGCLWLSHQWLAWYWSIHINSMVLRNCGPITWVLMDTCELFSNVEFEILLYSNRFSFLNWMDEFTRQQIIGLHHYETRQLLIHLSYFTFLVVITAIQFLIFDKKYTKQFMWQTIEKGDKRNDQNEQNNTENGQSESNSGEKTYLDSMIQGVSSLIGLSGAAFDWTCRFLEIQSFKIILVLGFIMSISEVCRNECI